MPLSKKKKTESNHTSQKVCLHCRTRQIVTLKERTYPPIIYRVSKYTWHYTTYLETRSFKTAQAKFRSKFDNYPQKSQIYHWVHKFQATGSVNNFKKKAENPRSGKKLTTRCPYNVDAVRDSVGRSPKKSLQSRSQELGLSHVSFQKIFKDLQRYSYRIQLKH